jgi:hypothetical protein
MSHHCANPTAQTRQPTGCENKGNIIRNIGIVYLTVQRGYKLGYRGPIEGPISVFTLLVKFDSCFRTEARASKSFPFDMRPWISILKSLANHGRDY